MWNLKTKYWGRNLCYRHQDISLQLRLRYIWGKTYSDGYTIMIIKLLLSYLQASQNGHSPGKESPFNVSRVFFFYLFSPLLCSICLYVLLNTSLQGSEIETQATTQEQESDAKTRRYHLDRQRVCCLPILSFSDLSDVPFFLLKRDFLFLAIGECWCSYQLRKK